jgi:hypothetical protein
MMIVVALMMCALATIDAGAIQSRVRNAVLLLNTRDVMKCWPPSHITFDFNIDGIE